MKWLTNFVALLLVSLCLSACKGEEPVKPIYSLGMLIEQFVQNLNGKQSHEGKVKKSLFFCLTSSPIGCNM